MNILSAPLGALLLTVLTMEQILMIDMGTALLAVVPLFFFAIPQPARNASPDVAGAKPTVWQDFRAGLKYMWDWPGLMIIGLMATIINFLISPAFSLLPILVTKHFGGQAIQLATLESTWGLGVVLGGITLGVWGGFRKRIFTSLGGLILMGASIIFVGLAPGSAFTLAVIAMFVAAFANPICNGPLLAAVQAAVAPEMQGRVFSLISSFASAMTPIGLIIAGPLADRIGPNSWFVVGGIVTTLMGLIAYFIPAVAHFEDGRGDHPASGEATPAIVPNPAEAAD
jgi:DHA3 family macrolide efflux protein-like MFS transporter